MLSRFCLIGLEKSCILKKSFRQNPLESQTICLFHVIWYFINMFSLIISKSSKQLFWSHNFVNVNSLNAVVFTKTFLMWKWYKARLIKPGFHDINWLWQNLKFQSEIKGNMMVSSVISSVNQGSLLHVLLQAIKGCLVNPLMCTKWTDLTPSVQRSRLF